MHSLRFVAAGLVFAWTSATYAQPPIAAFASGQLQFAEAALERARTAQANGDVAAARRYAAQAELDARLAWSMSETAHMRRAAADVVRAVANLRYERVIAAPASGPIPAPAPVSAPAPVPAPTLQLPELPKVDLTSALTRP